MPDVGITIRRARLDDIPGILSIEEEVWPENLRASEEQFVSRIKTFSEGTVVALMNGTIVGVIATEIINRPTLDRPVSELTWEKITDGGFIKKTHNPHGDILYGVDLSVSPYGAGASTKLIQEIGRTAIRHRLKGAMLGARIPRYHKYAGTVDASKYVQKRKGNRLADPELAFYHRMGLRVVKVIPDYIEDADSCNYGVLLTWSNPFYGKPFPKFWSRLFRIK